MAATPLPNRGPELATAAWVETAVAAIFVFLRLYTRLRYVKKLWWDDWFMVLTLVSRLCLLL